MHTQLVGQLGARDEYSRSVPIVASTPNPVEGEALTAWDLTRYLKNPVVLWAHDDKSLPIGTASEVVFTPGVGLTARVRFARAEANPLAEQVWQGIRDGIVRAVSVGYDPAKDDGPALLVEISLVPIGLDEDAGTPALNPEAEPDEEMIRARISSAARELALHRARASEKKRAAAAADEGLDMNKREKSTHTDASTEVFRLDVSRLGKVVRTQVGGAHVPAMLSRTGVLTYVNPDGSKRRELRLAAEVFKADSLKTLEHAPVIDIKDHTGMVTPETWRKVSLGHVGTVRQDGRFIASELVIQDADTLDMIEQGERTEVSCGYQCHLDFTPGTHEGEVYDCVQRNIRYNHAALCPPNRGRAGPSVGLRLDTQAPLWGESHYEEEEQAMAVKVRFDGREYEEGSREHLDAVERGHKAELDKVRAEHDKFRADAKADAEQARMDAKAEHDTLTAATAAEKKRADEAEGRADAAKQDLETFKTDATKAQTKKDEEDEKKKLFERSAMRSKVRLVGEVARFFGNDDEGDKAGEEEEGDDGTCECLDSGGKLCMKCKMNGCKAGKECEDPKECDGEGEAAVKSKAKKSKSVKKMDAKFDALFDQSDRDLMLGAIKLGQPNFDATDRSDDYVRSRYDALLETVKNGRGIDGVRRAIDAGASRLDADDDKNDPIGKAKAAQHKAAANAWKKTDANVNGGG